MSVERPTPQVVAFDGLHRSGKGTQAFLLHRGVFDTSDDVSIHDLYPGNSSLDSGSRVDFKKTLPSILFNLSPKNPKVLLDRLDKDDPKYQFRSRNIKGGFNAAQSAVDLLPKNLQEIVVDIDCSEDERVIHNRVVRSLGRVGLGSWLKMVDD